jgi:hypothetical protein
MVPLAIFDALIAVSAIPLPEILVKVPTLAVNDPLASRATIVLAPFAEAAVVLALSKVPDVTFEALIAVRATPLPVNDAPVIAPAVNSPEVPRNTIVEAPLAVAAVVLALATVPVVTFDPLIAEIEAPPPMKLVAVIAFAVKFPEASRATMVLAPLADAAVVAELGMLVNEAPEPLNVVAVITFPAKEPAALRETIVDAPLASEAVVRALAIVPLDMFEALIAVKPPPAPLTVVNVPTLAVNDPLASRATMVLAPLAEAAVV